MQSLSRPATGCPWKSDAELRRKRPTSGLGVSSQSESKARDPVARPKHKKLAIVGHNCIETRRRQSELELSAMVLVRVVKGRDDYTVVELAASQGLHSALAVHHRAELDEDFSNAGNVDAPDRPRHV